MSADIADTAGEYAQRRRALVEELREHPSGLDWCARHTDLVDELVRSLYVSLLQSVEDVPRIAIVATGGYGRRELSPWSDVDLRLVPLDEAHPQQEKTIKWLFRHLHEAFSEAMRLKVGYALSYASDAPGFDAKTRAALLESRVVVGSHEAHEELMRSLWSRFPVADFVIEKLREQAQHEQRTNETPYAVQPHLKSGAGGLRSFQTANWIGAAIGERMARPSHAYDSVVKCRNLLHLAAGRYLDHLTILRRDEVAGMLGLEPLELGSRLAKDLAENDAVLRSAIERLHEARFELAPRVEAIRGEARISATATTGEAALGISNATRLGLRVSDVPARTLGQASASQAFSALTSGERTLRNLDRCGVLEALLPELTACRTLMPSDSSHAFTVFEHTLRVVRNLDAVPPDTFIGFVMADLEERGPLYLASLLHDVGRAESEDRHAEIGAEMAERVCERWDVYESTKDTVCWLVRHHLEFGRVIRMRDVMNPETAAEFAVTVQTPERLALLAVLTWADVSAVAEGAWTPAHETFMRELYGRTLSVLTTAEPAMPETAQTRRRLLGRTKDSSVPQELFEAFLESMPSYYLLSTEPALAQAHFGLFQSATAGEVSVVVQDVPAVGGTEVTVCCPDAPGVLSKILGVLYANDLSIVGIRASTSQSETPVALDTITVSSGGRPVTRRKAARVAPQIEEVLRGRTRVEDALIEAKKDPDRLQRVLTYQFLPGRPSIIEVQAPRGRGLAFRLSRQLSAHGIDIVGARVGQWAGTGTAAFYVTGANGVSVDAELVARALGDPGV